MARTKTAVSQEDPRPMWQKVGGGSLHVLLGGKRTIIKPGQKFRAYQEEIPKAFRDVVVCLDDVEQAKLAKKVPVLPFSKKPVVVIRPKYMLRPSVTEEGLFDIVNENGKIISEVTHPVTEDEGNKMIKEMER
jgi:hypothetical protein